MADVIEHKVDRTGWGPGPWDGEPDRMHWVDEKTGLDCLIVRAGRCGNLCGYVGVPQGHPCYEKDYMDIDANIEVHGGLTYAKHCAGSICHAPGEAANEPVWWLGFDCMHLGDIVPGSAHNWARAFLGDFGGGGTYRSIQYVRSECTRLAEQLAALAN